MPLFRIMMKPVAGYPAECWAECDHEHEIAPLIAEMRSQFGQNEPARVLRYEGFANERESVFLVDDPAGMFTAEEATGPHFEFDQQDHGAVMPAHVAAPNGTCSQCGRKGPVATVRLIGMGQRKQAFPCAECFFDMAAGTPVLPMMTALVLRDDGKWKRVGWNPVTRQPVIADTEGSK
jgi:hypothetical protein